MSLSGTHLNRKRQQVRAHQTKRKRKRKKKAILQPGIGRQINLRNGQLSQTQASCYF